MLVSICGNCDECGRTLGLGATIQSAGVTCNKCGHKFNACDRCKNAGCQKCGGKLLDAWEYIEHGTGQIVMF